MNIRHILAPSLVAFAVATSVVAAPTTPGWLGLGISVRHGTAKAVPSWIYVHRLAPNGPAERAGIRPQDIITAIDGVVVRFAETADALRYFATLPPGRTVTFSILRQNRTLTIRVKTMELPAEYRPLWEHSRQVSKQRQPPP
jgi:S1-C subfamily serine protease